jgi:Cu+-exporting ATPase
MLERLAKCTTVLIDKTGTPTSGRPALATVVPAGALPTEEILALAGSLDQFLPSWPTPWSTPPPPATAA